jgi:lipoprotein LprG
LAACSSGSSDEGAAPVDVESVLAASADAMAAIDTVSFQITRSGAPVYLDPGGSLAFEEATGRFSSQAAAADAVVKVTALGIETQVGAVSIDGELLLSNPLTGTWERAPDTITFDPVSLFDPETGWQPLLRTDLTDAKLVDDAEPGRRHVAGRASGARLAAITGGLVHDDAPIDLWLDIDTGRVLVAVFDTVTGAEPSKWRMELSDYGAEVVITRPELGSGG